MTIYIIGAGNIGRRHLQSTLLLSESFNIYVVETNPDNLNQAKSIIAKTKNKDVLSNYFFETLLPENKKIDLLYLATTAINRFQLFTIIIKKNVVSNVIFEKVIFQIPEQYQKCQKLLDTFDIKAWVNNWPRTTLHYQKIKNLLAFDKQLTMKVLGNDWGIACNLTHYIDLFLYLINQSTIAQPTFYLEKLFDSKRPGFKECYGTFSLAIEEKYFLEISDTPRFPKGLQTNIYNGSNVFKITESNGKILLKSNLEKISNELFDEPLQSMTSHIHMQSILTNSFCLLPAYQTVYEWHSIMVNVLNEAIGIEKGKACPIT